VFDKEALFERVWGMEALGDASTVTVTRRGKG
jgi:DNA-binding response OmpR family regulator